MVVQTPDAYEMVFVNAVHALQAMYQQAVRTGTLHPGDPVPCTEAERRAMSHAESEVNHAWTTRYTLDTETRQVVGSSLSVEVFRSIVGEWFRPQREALRRVMST